MLDCCSGFDVCRKLGLLVWVYVLLLGLGLDLFILVVLVIIGLLVGDCVLS